jgi:L-alanine-DL-glutamate epimerase-like enolase superfamily enzyme
MDRATLLTVECSVQTRAGKVATGIASMPFNHIFSYPSKAMSHEAKNSAMKSLAAELARVTGTHTEYSDPIDLNWALEPAYLQAAAGISDRLRLPDPIPKLCTLVTASAFDSAIHDAFGRANSINCFLTYGPAFMNHDVGHYHGAAYRGIYPGQYLLPQPKPRMTLCHLIGAVDPITAEENATPIRDGLPETLPEWINHNGLRELKIKVNGDNLGWDVERVRHIDYVMTETQQRRGGKDWEYVIDFNEKCPHLEYYLEFLHTLKEKMPAGFARIKYVEQPVARDLKRHPENRMHAATRLCPAIIDESLIDVESLLLAQELGWSGAVLKSPKGLSNMLRIAAVAGKHGIFLGGGDMSCPGRALIQTAGLQARVPSITAVEANARQYLPQANQAWEAKFPGMFRISDGLLQTSELAGPGLGA